MFGGTERTKTVRYWVDTGGRVNHFNYFANADTASRLGKALTDETAPQSLPLARSPKTTTASGHRFLSRSFLLPGTMGSTLAVDGDRVWIDRLDLALGGMERLRAGAPKMRPESLVDSSYRDLVRRSTDSAVAPRKAIDAKLDTLDGTEQPVRIIAHSMGGLVVAQCSPPPTIRRRGSACAPNRGARFLMLGTPNGGSHAIGAMLMGRDRLVKQLALLDLRHDHGEILAIIAEYDGALHRSGVQAGDGAAA